MHCDRKLGINTVAFGGTLLNTDTHIHQVHSKTQLIFTKPETRCTLAQKYFIGTYVNFALHMTLKFMCLHAQLHKCV